MKRTFWVMKDPTIEAQDNWLIMDYRQYAAWRETDEGRNREIVLGKLEACSDDDTVIFMECSEEASKELKKDCHRRQYIRDRNLETSFQVMSYSTMTFHDADICGEDVLEDKDCNVEEEVVQSLDIERVRAALKALTPGRTRYHYELLLLGEPLVGRSTCGKICNNKVEHLPQKRSRAEEAEKHSG